MMTHTLRFRGSMHAGPSAACSNGSENPSISYYENHIPQFIEHEMEWLYQNLFSSVAMVRAYGGTDGVSTYVARRNGEPTAIFLLRRHGSRIDVLNEQVHVDAAEIDRMVCFLFERFPDLGVVAFSAIATDADPLAFPFQRADFTNDIVLALPSDPAKYLASLGKSTRQNIRYYLSRIQRDYPSFRHAVFENGAEGETVFADILHLNRARMSEKAKVYGVDDAESARLRALARERGLVSVVTIDDRVCAGAISYRVGDNYFLRVIAHDSRFNAYGLGLLCCYLAISECIARGGKEFHFMWGREEYKYRLLGKHRDFDTLAIYRSRLAMLLDGRRVAATLLRQYRLQAKDWLLDPQNQAKTPARQARALMNMRRKLRRARHGNE